MNAVNAVLLVILVWTFTAVCRADDDEEISVICEDVTGAVGEEVTLTCSVSLSLECPKRCITLYKFLYPEGDSEICREEFPRDSCEQRNSFTCRFTQTTAMTEQFRFFVQTQCGGKSSGFTVIITEPITTEPANKDSYSEDPNTGKQVKDPKKKQGEDTVPVVSAVVGCLFIIIITLTIIYKTKPNYSKLCGFQRRMFLSRRDDEDDSNSPENII